MAYSEETLYELGQQFAKEYEFLYNADCNHQYVAGYDEALDFGLEMLDSEDDLMIEYARYRQDPLTSDREIAAFAFAVTELGLR